MDIKKTKLARTKTDIDKTNSEIDTLNRQNKRQEALKQFIRDMPDPIKFVE